VETARRALRRRLENRFRLWISATMLLGLCFLAAQLVLWQRLVASGFYVNRNHHSGYAYIFTGLHGAHLIGGLIALGYVMLRERSKWTTVRRRVSVDATVLYWHFLDGLWIYLLALLFYWRGDEASTFRKFIITERGGDFGGRVANIGLPNVQSERSQRRKLG